MEVIRKEISAEHGRSRSMGLLPYIAYNGNGLITYVEPNTANGNWGNFVCDLVYTDSNEVSTRFKYLELMRKYFFIQDQLRNGVMLKKFVSKKKTVQKIDCEGDGTVSGITTVYAWRVDEAPEVSRYQYFPVQYSTMTKDANGIYSTSDSSLYGKDYIVLVNDTDTINSYESAWNNSPLRGLFGDGIDCYFNFCAGVDKYFLGLIEVPYYYNNVRIRGAKVPSYISYFNINDWRDWFNTHYHSSMTDSESEDWAMHGGNTFREYLNSISDSDIKWMISSTVPEGLTFVAPYSEVPILLTDDYKAEGLKVGYVSDDETYTEDNSTQYLDLTLPQYEKMQGKVSSQLSELRVPQYTYSNGEPMDYILKSFYDTDGATIRRQMFKCTCHQGSLTKSESAVTKTIYTEISAYTGEKKTVASDKITYSVSAFEGTYPTVVADCYQVASITVKSAATPVSQTYHTEESGDYGLVNEYDFTVTKSPLIYTWWECSKYSGAISYCADGEAVSQNDSTKYRTLTVLDGINEIEKGSDDAYYFFSVRYDNGYTSRNAGEAIDDYSNADVTALELPYQIGIVLNQRATSIATNGVMLFAGDTVESIENINGFSTIIYRMGANFSASTNGVLMGHDTNSGFLYKETIPYSASTFIEANLDGTENPIHLVEIPYGTAETQVYGETSDSSNSAMFNVATIIGGEFSVPQTSEGHLITKENLNGFYDEPNYDVDIYINRGSAAAFERHFKLGECNTMEDLENYGNGEFFS